MRKELSKQQRKVRNSVNASSVFSLILSLTTLGLLIYFVIAERQLSRYPNNILSIVLIVSLLGFCLNGKFWLLPALKKYGEEFSNLKPIRKRTKVLIGVGIGVFIIFGSSFLLFLRYLNI